MPDIPEHLRRRSAEARAKALGVPLEQVLAEMGLSTEGTEPLEVIEEVTGGVNPDVAGTTIPEDLRARESAAREKALGGPAAPEPRRRLRPNPPRKSRYPQHPLPPSRYPQNPLRWLRNRLRLLFPLRLLRLRRRFRRLCCVVRQRRRPKRPVVRWKRSWRR